MTATEPAAAHGNPRAVPLLRWPAQEADRWRLAALGQPRILLVADGVSAPPPVDQLERHLHEGSGADAVLQAIASLGEAPPPPSVPYLDEDGLLWCRGRWVAVSDIQIPVVELILANAGRLTRNEDILAVYRDAGGSDTSASLKAVIYRIGQRFAAVGLDLQVVRTRGVILAGDS